MSWQERFVDKVTEVKAEELSGKEDLTEEEKIFLLCALTAKAKLFALNIAGRVLVVPGNSADDLWLYALDGRGGIRKVGVDEAEKKIERLIPSMPFSKATRCKKCDSEFSGGDVVFTMHREDTDSYYCWSHIRFALKYSRGHASGSIAYSFHAADDIDRQDPVVISKVVRNVPRALDVMRLLLSDIVARAKKLRRQDRLADKWATDFQFMIDAQSATLRVLKFTTDRIATLNVEALKAEIKAALG